jgi:cytidylate kinase
MLIAIDGPAASGKGTIAKMIAAHFGLEYLDTGRLYRLVGFELMKNKISVIAREPELASGERGNPEKQKDNNWIASKQAPRNDELRELATNIAKNLDISNINNEEIETEEVGKAASIVSAIPEVRAALLDLQRRTAKHPKGAVLDGRDIGTVICPNANFKFFITAKPEIRANRRYLQLKSKNKDVTEQQVLNDIISRDERDSNRSIAPLLPAIDAISIDTSNIGINDVFERVKGVIEGNV